MKLNKLQTEIFQTRHAINPNETYDQAATRVAKHVAQAESDDKKEKWTQVFEEIISKGWWSPGGRITFGSGRKEGQLLNCFVLVPEDNIQSIGQTISEMYQISCKGGGVGFNFSKLRPKGDNIAGMPNSAPGSVSVMKMINEIAEHVRAGAARRTALMSILNVTHPDLLEFLHVKLDLKELNNFNVSVAITDAFIEAVRANKSWHFEFRGQKYNTYQADRISADGAIEIVFTPALSKEDALGRFNYSFKKASTDKFADIKQIDLKARSIWEQIIENSVHVGDPGLYHIDYANRYTNVHYFEEMPSTNPCQPANATVLTPNGIRTFETLHVGDEIWSGTKWTKVIKKWSNGIKPVYKFHTTAGVFLGTDNHRIVSDGEKVEVGNASSIDTCSGPEIETKAFDQLSVMDGLVIGDGSVHKASNNLVYLIIGKDDQDYFDDDIKDWIKKERPGLHDGAYEVTTNINHLELPKTYERYIPNRYRFTKPYYVASFLRGLYSANGSVVDRRVTLKSASLTLIKQVQEMLSSIGIRSYYTTNQSHDVEFDNGTYTCKQSYDLNISGDRRKFAQSIGFIQKYKMEKLSAVCEIPVHRPKTTFDIISKEYVGDEEVFDITVDDVNHTYWTGGLLVSNCGEVPLAHKANCCLGNVNLSEMYCEAENDVDWKRLAYVVRSGIRFLDDVLTVNSYPVDGCKEAAERSRRIGLGVLGLHYLLLKLGHTYGSEKCVEFIERLFTTIRNEAYLASIDIAKEKGSFAAFDKDKFLAEGFAQTLPARIKQGISKYGIRNAVMLTVPPTGNTGMVLGVSTGIEPIFAPVYERTFRENNIWKTVLVVDKLFEEFVLSGKDVSHFVGAHDVTVDEHMAVQAAVQKFVDSSISKTINIPEDANPKDISSVVLEYVPYLKGVTLYRTNSRGIEPLKPVKITDEIMANIRRSKYNVEASTVDCASGSCNL